MSESMNAHRTSVNLGDAFSQIALLQPDRPAITLGKRTLTYAELDTMSTRIASSMRARGVQPGDLVALVCDRSIELIAAMLGSAKAGAAYLPIDPRYPTARITQTLADSRAKLVVTDTFGAIAGSTMLGHLLAATTAVDARPERSREDLAYLIYTSGSTGTPKGVMITQGNVLRLFTETDAWFGFTPDDVWTMFHSSAFDFSVWEIWGALLTGGRLVLVPYETCRDPQAVCALIEAERVTVLNQSPAAFGLLMQAESRKPATVESLRYVIFGGEALNLPSLLPWFERHGDEKPALINMYGITETTVHVTYRRIRQADAECETDSLIGVPIPDLQLYVLDEGLQPVAEGELFVGGAGVARGYWNKAELTAERFIDNPFSPGKLYRSGDLARRRDDGELVYLGRGDRQVKLRGFRIELGEIEAVLFAHGKVTQVVADVLPNGSLTVFFVGEARVSSLTAHAAALLPDHMRPTRYVPVRTMPLTINGKVDRAALAAVAESSAGPAPSNGTTLENRIVLVWQNVLQTSVPPGPEMNFFEAGGNSLLLQSLRVALEAELAQPVSILSLFQYPTVRSFAAQLPSEGPAKAQPVTPQRTGFRALKKHGKVAHR